jgi:hypothetical protein
MEVRPDARPKLPPLAWLLLALSAALCLLWFVHALGYWEDDSYIHLEFARSVASGQGFAFNGHVVYGDTSPLWVFLLDAVHLLIPECPHCALSDWLLAGKTLTALGCLFALSGVFFFSRSLTRSLSPAASSTFAAAMVLVTVTNPYFGYWAFSGMEALSAAGLVCWTGVALSPKRLSPTRFLLAAFAAGLAPILRPEMSFFTLLVGLILLADLIRDNSRTFTRRFTLLLGGLILIATPALLWARYALHAFGMIVPNTNAAKRAEPGDSIPSRLIHLYTFGFPVIVIGLLLLAAWLVWYYTRGKRSGAQPVSRLLHAGGWLLFVWTGLTWVFYTIDHTYVQTRYIFVTAPVLTIAILALAIQLRPALYRGLVTLALVVGIAVSALTTWPLVHNKVLVDRDYADLAAYIKTLPPNAGVAHYSIGEAAFLSQHPIVDTGGITRPGIIAFLNDPTDTRRLNWIYDQGAQYEVIDHSPTPGAILTWSRDIPSTGWFLNPRAYRATERLQVWKLPARH